MTAREMFEALDYEFEDYHWSNTGSQATLVPQDEPMTDHVPAVFEVC